MNTNHIQFAREWVGVYSYVESSEPALKVPVTTYTFVFNPSPTDGVTVDFVYYAGQCGKAVFLSTSIFVSPQNFTRSNPNPSAQADDVAQIYSCFRASSPIAVSLWSTTHRRDVTSGVVMDLGISRSEADSAEYTPVWPLEPGPSDV